MSPSKRHGLWALVENLICGRQFVAIIGGTVLAAYALRD